jgi:hypothetical protein
MKCPPRAVSRRNCCACIRFRRSVSLVLDKRTWTRSLSPTTPAARYRKDHAARRDELVGKYDVLFIDEAGQLALGDALACAGAAHNVVLLGTPFSSRKSRKARIRSAPARRCSNICSASTTPCRPTAACFSTSPIACIRRSAPSSRARSTMAACTPPRRPPTASSPIPSYTADIVVVMPYNVQRTRITRTLAARSHTGVRVGTVAQFQGQEAAGEDMPRDMSFLFEKTSRSRARSVSRYWYARRTR